MPSPLIEIKGSGGIYKMPATGRCFIQVLGQGNVYTVTINDTNTTIAFNTDTALTSTALYEFEMHVVQGDALVFSGSTWARIFFAVGEA